MRQDGFEPEIVVLRHAKADQLTLRPSAAAVHAGIDAPRHRGLARETQCLQVTRAVPILGRIERPYCNSGAIVGVLGFAEVCLELRTPATAGLIQLRQRERHSACGTCALCSPAHPSPPKLQSGPVWLQEFVDLSSHRVGAQTVLGERKAARGPHAIGWSSMAHAKSSLFFAALAARARAATLHTISSREAPGWKISRTPALLSLRSSASGTMPPTITGTSSSRAFFNAFKSFGTRRWSVASEDMPITSTSSSSASRTTWPMSCQGGV